MASRDPLAVGFRGCRAAWLAPALALLIAGAAQAAPHLTLVAGDVQIGRGEPMVFAAAREGAEIGSGEAVRTGSDGRAEVDLGTAVVRLYENSLLRLPVDAARPDGPAAVGLDGGSSLFQVAPRLPHDPFEVRTPEVVASVKGTSFGVALGAQGGVSVSVFSGLVGVHGLSVSNEREVMVYPGFAATGASGRPFELSLVPPGDAWSGWHDGAPAPPLPAGARSAASQAIEDARAAARNAAAREIELSGQRRDASLAGANVPADIDRDGLSAGADRTPVDRVVSADSPASRPIQSQVVGAILNGTAPATGGATPGLGPLTVQLVTQGGPNQLVISGTQGVIGQVTQGQVNTVLQTGSAAAFGPQIASVLNNTGVDPVAFAKQLSSLLH